MKTTAYLFSIQSLILISICAYFYIASNSQKSVDGPIESNNYLSSFEKLHSATYDELSKYE
jgi:hypothetical protein